MENLSTDEISTTVVQLRSSNLNSKNRWGEILSNLSNGEGVSKCE